MSARDGRDARTAYRVRVGATWYWVDPTVPRADLEGGDMVVIYLVKGDAHLAILQGKFDPAGDVGFSGLDGARFSVPAAQIEAVHLAAVDDEQ
jgi:hypothetical protein